MALTTAALYKARTNIVIADDDAVITILLAEAEATIARFVDRTLEDAGTDIVEVLSGDGTNVLQLSAWPINSFTAVKRLESVAAGVATYTAIDDSTYYRVDGKGKLIRTGFYDWGFEQSPGAWPVGDDNLEVTYKAGYITATTPDWLFEAIYGYTDLLWFSRAGNAAVEDAPNTDPNSLNAWLWEKVGHARKVSL